MKRRISTSTLLGQLKETVKHESDNYTNCIWCSWYSYQRIEISIGGLRNNMTSGDHPNNCSIEIGQNTTKSPGDLRRIAVIQTPVKDNQLTLIWKNSQVVTITTTTTLQVILRLMIWESQSLYINFYIFCVIVS